MPYAGSGDGEPRTPLTASATAHNGASVLLTSGAVSTHDGDVAQGARALPLAAGSAGVRAVATGDRR